MKDSAATEQARRALGAELAAYRDAAGCSQAQLAMLTTYSRSTIANVVPRQFWEHADTALRTGGVLATGHDQLEAAARQERQAAARAATAARTTVIPSSETHAVSATGAEDRGGEFIGALVPASVDLATTEQRVIEAAESLVAASEELSTAEARMSAGSVTERAFRPGDLIRLQGMRQQLKDIDNSHGGGIALPLAMSYARSEIAPLLNGLTGTAADRALIDVVALFQLDVGWMAYDAAQQPLAAQQYVGALRLARSSGNRLLVARVLAAMSHQAIYLGQIRKAVDYAQAARAATVHVATPRTTAMLAAMQACAFAASGDACNSRRMLNEAAGAVALIRAQPEPDSLDFDEGGYWGHAARAYRDLGQLREAEMYAQKSVGMCLPDHSRTRAQRYAIHAIAHLRMGEIEAAAAAGVHIVREGWNLNSSHVLGEITRLSEQITPFKAAAATDFLDQARELLDARGPRSAGPA